VQRKQPGYHCSSNQKNVVVTEYSATGFAEIRPHEYKGTRLKLRRVPDRAVIGKSKELFPWLQGGKLLLRIQ